MDAIINTIESDYHLHMVVNKKAMKTIEKHINVNTLVPDFTFLNHKGEKIAVASTSLF